MDPQPQPTDPHVYAKERRELLLHVLDSHKQKGGRVELPIGMDTPENWLLDIVDTQKLVNEIKSGRTILELIKFKRDRSRHARNTSNLTDGILEGLHITSTPPRNTPTKAELATAGNDAHFDPPQEDDTLLPLPQLKTGLEATEIKDLAYLVFAALCPDGHHELLPLVRQQLGLSDARSREMQDALMWCTGSKPGTPLTPRTPEANGRGHAYQKPLWSQQEKSASLQMLAMMLERTRPGNFARFKHFVRFRGTVAHILVESLQLAARESWIAPPSAPVAKTLIARLKGAVRRLDVQTADDYDEVEYSEAARAVSEAAAAVAGSVQEGWRFPWCLRVRLAELLLRCIFDDLDEGSFNYVEEHEELLAVLREYIWPLLGVSGLVDAVCTTWSHFQKFLVTAGSRQLLGIVQRHIQLLASQTTNPKQSPDEQELAAQVGEKILEWTEGRVRDYHVHYSDGEEVGAGLALLRFVLQLTGHSRAEVSGKMAEVVMGSMDAEYQRRMEALANDNEAELMLGLANVTGDLLKDESRIYSPVLEQHLPGARALAALRLHSLFSHSLLPWLGNVENLEDDVLDAIRASEQLEPNLLSAMEVRDGSVDDEVMRLLSEKKPWNLSTQLQTALSKWVSNQMELFDTCTTRNLETEDWKPQGGRGSGFSHSAREVVSITVESLDILFRFNIPVAPEIVSMHLESVDNMLRRYATAVRQRIGPVGRLIPPPPPVTRFKQKDAVRQEQAESGHQPKISIWNKMTALQSQPSFLESVPRIDSSLSHLTPEVLSCMASSLQYLSTESLGIASTAMQRYKAQRLGRVTGMLDELLESGRDALGQALQHVLKFLAAKVVFWDGRRDWLEMLYRHRVTNTNNTVSHLIVPQLENHLAIVSDILPRDIIQVYAEILITTCAMGLERVLLDGGPTRLFVTADVPLIEADTRELKKLFYAEGEGLPPTLIESLMEPVANALKVMSIETGPLLNDLGRARLNRDNLGEALLLKVAAHRADRNTSKFLKNPPYNIGKKLR